MKYKIGDRVRVTRNLDDLKVGDIGIIVDSSTRELPIDNDDTVYKVEFNGYNRYFLYERELASDSEHKFIQKESVEIGLPTPDNQTIDEYLSEITDVFNELKEKLKEKYITEDVVKHDLNTRYYGYDGAYEIILTTYRLETDEEYFERINEEYRQAEKAERKRLDKLEKKKAKREADEAAERAEYERLKAKFGVEE